MPGDIKQLRNRLIKKARKQVMVKYAEKDVHIIRAVSVLGDLDNSFNLLAESVIEWYGSHFPEMHSLVRDNEVFLKIVAEIGNREKIDAKSLSKLLGEDEKGERIGEKAKKSMGSKIPERALEEIRELAKNGLKLKEERKRLQTFIEKEMSKLAPNFSEVAGPVLGARLMASASGLKQLAMMPASTIQLLGAEKALFRHLKNKKSKGPKYGHIYGHPLVKMMPGRHKGKVARSLASKLVIAVRSDYFGGKSIAKELIASLEKRAKQLK